MTVKINRRENLRLLAKALGGIGEVAKFLDKAPSQISHLIGIHTTKNIGDRLAADIEKAFDKPAGWLDMDHTQHVDEILGQTIPLKRCNRVPLLGKHQIITWISQGGKIMPDQHFPFIYTSLSVSAVSYAMQVQTDSMEAPSGVTFPQGSTIIIDPKSAIKNDAYAIICLNHTADPVFRQLKYLNGKPYLYALNPRYPNIELGESYLFCGAVRQVILNAK